MSHQRGHPPPTPAEVDQRWQPPALAVAVDLVVLTVRPAPGGRPELCALLVRRGIKPFEGRWALPGGFVLPREDLSAAAVRELREETGLTGPGGHLEQLATYGNPNRDPRGRVITVAYLALLPDLPAPMAGSDAADAEWLPYSRARRLRLAFDHNRILGDGVERARAKLEYTSLAAAFCPAEFTIAALREVYEAVWAVRLDPRNFHRKATKTPGFVEPTRGSTTGDRGRPARLYRRGPAASLHPPMLRSRDNFPGVVASGGRDATTPA